MRRLVLLAVLPVTALVRVIVREELAAESAAWDAKVAADIDACEAQLMADALMAELDDPVAVDEWLWSGGPS